MKQVLLTSPWVPHEWVEAHHAQPRGLWYADEPSPSSPPQEAGRCGYAHAATRMAQETPEALLIFTSHCNQLRRSFDLLPETDPHRFFLFNLPACVESPGALDIYVAEMKRLSRFLIRAGTGLPTASSLAKAILDGARKRENLLRAAETLPSLGFLASFAGGINPSSSDFGSPANPVGSQQRVPLGIVGGPLLARQQQAIREIEQAGGRIVLTATEPGERQLWFDPQLVGAAKTPQPDLETLLAELARTYVSHAVDAYQRPNRRLYEWLSNKVRERDVRGLILWHYTWCDLWRAEAETLKSRLGLPVLLLQADETPGEAPRNLSRVEAFLESLR